MEPNPLDELYAIAKERATGKYKTITAAYVVQMIDMHRAREKAVKTPYSDSKC
jgi:hypothetical protein